MHGVDLHGDAAASMPVRLLANPVHFSRTPIVYDSPRLRWARTRLRPGGSCWTVPEWD
jgi:hypothetical protein